MWAGEGDLLLMINDDHDITQRTVYVEEGISADRSQSPTEKERRLWPMSSSVRIRKPTASTQLDTAGLNIAPSETNAPFEYSTWIGWHGKLLTDAAQWADPIPTGGYHHHHVAMVSTQLYPKTRRRSLAVGLLYGLSLGPTRSVYNLVVRDQKLLGFWTCWGKERKYKRNILRPLLSIPWQLEI